MTKDIICNMCGLSTIVGPPDSPATGPSGLICASVSGGYESTPGNGDGALDDCREYEFSLCEWCCDWLFSHFKIIPSTRDYLLESPSNILSEEKKEEYRRLIPKWKPAHERVKEDEWRSMKKQFAEEWRNRSLARGSYPQDSKK